MYDFRSGRYRSEMRLKVGGQRMGFDVGIFRDLW